MVLPEEEAGTVNELSAHLREKKCSTKSVFVFLLLLECFEFKNSLTWPSSVLSE
jgi:hypothetical protein